MSAPQRGGALHEQQVARVGYDVDGGVGDAGAEDAVR